MMENTIDSIKLLKLPHFEGNGDLVVMEGMLNLPFKIARVFAVKAPDGAIRGKHAHRGCSQLLCCPCGAVEVLCDDGQRNAEFVLNHPRLALLVPPGIWSQQTYRGPYAVLIGLCDRGYDANEYIRDYESFRKFRSDAMKSKTK